MSIDLRHQKKMLPRTTSFASDEVCELDRQPWPCEVAQLQAENAQLRATLARVSHCQIICDCEGTTEHECVGAEVRRVLGGPDA